MPAWHEVGGAAANAGVQIHEIGHGGRFSADELRAAVKPRNFAIFPTTTLVEVENTHNRAGGVVVPQDEVARHLRRGARARPGELPRRRTALEREHRQRPAAARAGGAVRPRRRRLQQGARRAGRIAAGGIEGDDRASPTGTAGGWAERCGRTASSPPRRCTRSTTTWRGWPRITQTRDCSPNASPGPAGAARPGHGPDQHRRLPSARNARDRCADAQRRARERGVLVNAFGPRTVRAVTHLDVTRDQCERAATVLVELLAE